jgi:6-phosphogluconolactonase (cycloisomerase 2 family)
MPAFTYRTSCLCLGALALTACGGGSDPASPASPTYTVGGTVTGLAGSGLVLQNNGTGNLAVNASGTFSFTAAVPAGGPYNVTVATQPGGPAQTCTVGNGTGTVGSANVTSVGVSCTTNTYTVGGTVTGLSSPGLVLQNNAGSDLTIAGPGAFTFPVALASGATYAVTVKTQPGGGPAQNCTVASASGTITSAAVSSVAVTCTTLTAKFLYTANTGAHNVSAYAINPNTGALTPVPGSPFAADQAPLFMSANRAGTALYVANQGSSSAPPRISAYSINGGTGALTAVPGSPFDLSHPPPANGAAAVGKPLIHPSGAFGYLGIRNSTALYGATIDAAGALAEIPGMPAVGAGQNFSGFDAAGKVLYVPHDSYNGGVAGGISAYTVNWPSGVLTPLASYATGGRRPAAITLTAAGTFLLSANNSSGSVAVFAVDAGTGVLSAVAGSPFSTGTAITPTGVTLHRSRNFVYVSGTSATAANSTIAAFRMDATTGVLTPVTGSPFSTGGTLAAAAVIDPSGKYLYIANDASANIQGFAIDQATGALSVLPGSPVATPAGPAPVVMDPSGRYLYSVNTAADSVSSYAIAPLTGALTLVNTVAAGDMPRFPELVGLQ